MSYLGNQSYDYVRIWAINDSEVAVGAMRRDSLSPNEAFRAHGNFVSLLSFGPDIISSVARGINNSGTIVGWMGNTTVSDIRPSMYDTAFVRSPAGLLTALPGAPHGALDVNDAGWIVGWRLDKLGPNWASFWLPRDGGYVLQAPPAPPEVFDRSELYGINNLGTAVGTLRPVAPRAWRALRASLDSTELLPPVPVLQPFVNTFATDIDDRGRMVGVVQNTSELIVFPGFGYIGTGIELSLYYQSLPRLNNHDRIIGTEQNKGPFTYRYGIKEMLPLPQAAVFAVATSLNDCGTIAGFVGLSDASQRPVLWRRMKNNTQVCDL